VKNPALVLVQPFFGLRGPTSVEDCPKLNAPGFEEAPQEQKQLALSRPPHSEVALARELEMRSFGKADKLSS
jgi:hypothetical protein